MEEGIFRGLFITVLNEDYNFNISNLITGLLFGLWHIVMPLRTIISGDLSLINFIILSLGYIILSMIMGIKWGILFKLTASLYMGLADHLFNNVIATNLLHLVSNGEADNLQIIRILIAQIISFIFIVYIYIRKSKM